MNRSFPFNGTLVVLKQLPGGKHILQSVDTESKEMDYVAPF